MIYIYQKTDFDKKFPENTQEFLSTERIEKVRRYKFDKDKELCCISFLLLRMGLYIEYGITEIPEILYRKYGKPYLKNRKMHFNISHCDNSVLCSISSYRNGCDIQDYRDSISDISDRVLTCEEKNISGENIKEMSRFWSLKEAYGKYYGYGLRYEFNKKDFSDICSSDKIQYYENLITYSKCFDKFAVSCFSEEPLKIKFVSYDDLSLFYGNRNISTITD